MRDFHTFSYERFPYVLSFHLTNSDQIRHVTYVELGHICKGRDPSTPQFVPTPFDVEQPNLAWLHTGQRSALALHIEQMYCVICQ